jgi:hypothetical protein
MRTASTLTLLTLFVGSGCARDVIPNTDVEDTAENREVIEFVERYRAAIEERDTRAMLALASERYYDDNGTVTGGDDLDYAALQHKLAGFDNVLDVRYEIRYRRVSYVQTRVLVDYLYTGYFKILGADDTERWVRRLSPNRIVLEREGEDYRILSGM